MADGYLNKCVNCVRGRVAKHRKKNINKINAYDRKRGLEKHRIMARKKYREKVRNDPDLHEKRLAYMREWTKGRRLKKLANNAVNNAVRDGKLKKKPCEKCGTEKGVHAHHDDYSKPLQVRWLCPTHHGEEHRAINERHR